MAIFLRLMRVMTHTGWVMLIATQVMIFTIGALLMPIFEKPDHPLQALGNYAWWYIVTAATVGYGDIAPASGGGRIIAALIIIFGIGTFTVIVTKMIENYNEQWRKKMKGLSTFNTEGHIVVMGYRKGDTEKLVEEVIGEHNNGTCIILCSSTTEENPLLGKVSFVKGPLTSNDVLSRACVARAKTIVIHGHDDNQALATALAVNSVNKSARIVVHLNDEMNQEHIARVNPKIECVVALTVPMLAQAIRTPGSTKIFEALSSELVDDDMHKFRVPAGATAKSFEEIFLWLYREFKAITIAVASDDYTAPDLNPDPAVKISGGMSVFYIAKAEAKINWPRQ